MRLPLILLILGAIMLPGVAARAGEAAGSARPSATTWVPISRSDVPDEVQSTFAAAAGGAALVHLQKVNRKGRIRYSAEFTDASGARYVVVAFADGTMLSIERAAPATGT